MQRHSDIRKKLRQGDIAILAKVTGYAEITVRSVMRGVRNNPSILDAAEDYIRGRRQLIERLMQEHSRNNSAEAQRLNAGTARTDREFIS